MAEAGGDVVPSVDEADKDPYLNSQTDLTSVSSSETAEFEGRSTHMGSTEAQPIPTEEDHLLQAAFNVLYTVPRAIEHFIDREYKGGFIKAIRDHKDKLKAKLRTEEWDLLTKIIVHHRLYHFYDHMIQDTILDNEVLDLLISRCILRKEDRAEIEHHPRQSDRNKCILDLLIQRPQDCFDVLLAVLRESSTVSKDLIDCMEGQQLSHYEVLSQSNVKSCITGFHSVRLQKNYHNLTQNLSNTESIIDSLISKGVLDSDDRAGINTSGIQAKINRKLIDHIRSKQDYLFFLNALKEDPVNAKLASDLESINVTQDELKLLETGTTVPQLTNRLGFQTLVTLVSMVKEIRISDTEPESHDTRLAADLYRLQSWYKKIIKMTAMDSQQYQQFVQTVKAIMVRIGGNNDPGVKETSLDTVTKQKVQKILHGLKEKEENSSLKEKIIKMKTELEEVIPKNIRDQIHAQMKDWETKDKMFVTTRASDYVMEQLQDNSCLTLTAPSGVGKSFIARHTALVLQKKGFNIIPVELPADIKTYYQPGKQTVFVVDDICGNFTANQQQIDNWKQLLPVIDRVIADKCCKIIVSCRLQVYKDDKFNALVPFKSCECNLISEKLCLTSIEKTNIAKTYIGTSMTDIDDLSFKCDFFPLLCSLYHEKEDVDVKEYFKNPFDVYKRELDRLSEHGDEGNYKLCSLALCVLSNNQLNEKWFQGKATDEQRRIINDTCEACEFNSIPKPKLKKALDTLDGTFIFKQNGIYKTVHNKLFDFLAHYFGHKMIDCLIDHGDSGLVHERFCWQTSPDDKKCKIDFIIEIPDDFLESYLKRLIKDWLAGKVVAVLTNNNMKVSSFREMLLQNILQLDQSQQVTLANTKDTAIPKEDCGSGSTPLILTCYYGYTDMVQWMLHTNVDMDQSRDDGVSGLLMASQEVHIHIIKILLEKDANVDLSSNKGHTEIVKLLLEKDANVELCNNYGWSPLNTATSRQGHTDIVKLLLEKDANVNLCNNDGCSPLETASNVGHTDIVKLLLEKDANVELCNKDDWSPLNTASCKGHTDIVKLLLEKDANVDFCNKGGFTPLITACTSNNISIAQLLIKHKPNVDAQTFDGGSALYFSVNGGNLEITQLLLENNADCNICGPNKQSIIDTIKNDPTKTLDKYKQVCFDSLIKNALQHVADYISKKSVDYVFDVEAGSSPLHIACFMGRIDVVRSLLDHNATINITNENGTTSLFFACELGHEDIVRLLLDKGADTQLCRLDGKSPLDIATDNGHTSIAIRMIVTEYMKK
ncbi:uncharacterized protein LOC143055111 [Mytilus galloprovincialis]|uniref:uncharacterized protein LOC143055111 n=1 Tax=Mytilus galloprovincialis TaxID=29158 RepID=UPI003F7BB896